jgi:uncharacterized integral membrane protein
LSAPEETAGGPAASSQERGEKFADKPAPKSRAGRVWRSLIPAFVLAAILVVFVVQNLQDAKVSFLTFSGTFPLALALLVAGALGALVVFCVGTVRMAQLRRSARRRSVARQEATGGTP